MKKNEVKIGQTYAAKVSDRIVQVRIDGTNSHGGWNATNTATGKPIRIKSPQRLRRAVKAGKDLAAPDEVKRTAAATAGQAAPAKKARGKKTAELKPKRASALGAAADVLKAEGKPMRAKEMIEVMATKGLWSSPAGKTPEATLYAAIIREVRDKGDGARFRKVERGQFAFNAKGAAQ